MYYNYLSSIVAYYKQGLLMMSIKNLYVLPLYFMLFLGFFNKSYAQNPQDINKYLADFERFKNSNNETELSATANKLGYAYWGNSDYDNAVKYFAEGIQYSAAIGNKNAIGVAKSSIGSILSEQGKHSEALRYLKESLAVYEEMKIGSKVAQSYLNIGVTTLIYKNTKMPLPTLSYP